MSPDDVRIDQLRQYLQHLTLQERSHVLAELERLKRYGETIDEVVIAELRAELREGGHDEGRERIAVRIFFEALEPVLVDGPPAQAGCGRISRGSLSAIWDWMTGHLLRAMASDYCSQIRRLVAANNSYEARAAAAAFQTKVVKILSNTLASANGAEQIRAELATYTSLPVIDDLIKMLQALRGRDTLAHFGKALPAKIKRLEGGQLVHIRTLLDEVRAVHADAVPFALTMVARRLKTPWQVIRLATKLAETKEVDDIAATPYADAVVVALDEIDEKRLTLRKALRTNRIAVARDILVDIYDIEHALRVRIDHLANSPWGRRLDEQIAAVACIVEAEVTSIPRNLHHILDSRSLHRHQSFKGRLVYLAWKIHDAVFAVGDLCRRLVAPALKTHS